ncbi:MAG: hypothetical protein EHM24_04370 [Acidobacteria bacterium]|nr:MAG: hypothetical protein EHM24_18610 [Acidobacteriota bacterium]RPJ75400.1 MAG: hypothetical protein EHM24_04370 [Acidobacteriota bacterium]
MTGTNERRTVQRIAFFTEASLEGLDVGRTDVRITEISAGGAFVDTRSVLPAGAVTYLLFTLGDRQLRVKAQVRYAIPSIGMGLAFTELSPEDRQTLAEFVGVR